MQRPFVRKTKRDLTAEIAAMARTYLKPRLIFDRCVDVLIGRRVQVPNSGLLLELIRSGLQARKAELIVLIDTHLTSEARTLLDDLFTTSDEQNRYRLTLLKKLSQSTKPTKIKEAIADYETLVELYDQFEGSLALDPGAAGIRYFAGSVLRSRLFQLPAPRNRHTRSDGLGPYQHAGRVRLL